MVMVLMIYRWCIGEILCLSMVVYSMNEIKPFMKEMCHFRSLSQFQECLNLISYWWSRLIGSLSQMVTFLLVTLLLKLNLHNKICSTRLPDTSTMNIVAKVGQTVSNNLQRCYCQNPNITSTQPQVNHQIGFDTNISLNHHLSVPCS